MNKSTQTTHVTRSEILKINWTTEPSGWLSGLTVRQRMEKEKNRITNEMIVIRLATKMGWRVSACGDFGIQFEKKPTLSVAMLVVGSIFCLVGIGVILLLIAIADYFAQKPEYIFVNRIELERDEVRDILERFSPERKKTNQAR